MVLPRARLKTHDEVVHFIMWEALLSQLAVEMRSKTPSENQWFHLPSLGNGDTIASERVRLAGKRRGTARRSATEPRRNTTIHGLGEILVHNRGHGRLPV
jgi:hypothetical protein